MAIMSFLDQGLNFSIHADAAWGAYFASMLRDPPPGQSKQNVEDEAFVPELSLSEYVIKQMEVFLVLKQQYLSFRGLSSFFFQLGGAAWYKLGAPRRGAEGHVGLSHFVTDHPRKYHNIP